MVGWHHRLDGQGFEKTPGKSEGRRSLACCSPWGHRESDTSERLSNNDSDVSATWGQSQGSLEEATCDETESARQVKVCQAEGEGFENDFFL